MTGNLDFALIGNGSVAALIDGRGCLVWGCLPRFDSDPAFCALLDDHDTAEDGLFSVDVEGEVATQQSYRRNSAVLETRIETADGHGIDIIDAAPRFKNLGRIFRPTMIVRVIRPLNGAARVRVRLRPKHGHGAHTPDTTRGTNHVRYLLGDFVLRLTTDAPVAYVQDETWFTLDRPVAFVLGPDESLSDAPRDLADSFIDQTDGYWREWCRYLSLPFEWQNEVIRAAITLKLCNHEETGAIVAAMTTSIPEAPGSGRTWDYRYCWLRDSFFVVKALNRLGVVRTMEGYIRYIENVVAAAPDGYLQPLFGIALEHSLDETTVDTLKGFRGEGPVRIGNGAYTQVQNDGYGSVVLACAQSFFDHRLTHVADAAAFERLEPLGEQAVQRWNEPDAGLWELRTRAEVHTYSAVLCWAACDRLSRIAEHIGRPDRAAHWRVQAGKIHAGIDSAAWNADIGAYTATFGGGDADASLLLMAELGFVDAMNARYQGTLAFIERELRHGDHLYRYVAQDDFGRPETAFTVCTFWYIDALSRVGRTEEARALFENLLSHRNAAGLLSEDIDPQTGMLWGNLPQTYSMVGLINAAMRLSKSWDEAL